MVEPNVPGWYRTIESTNWMMYSLDEFGVWHVFTLSGDSWQSLFNYVEQGGPIEMIARY